MTTGLREGERNAFLDAVRTTALLRVIVWHTYGDAWISYFVASMPAMFFVAGSLMAHSLRRGNAPRVLFRRFRRLLIPLWVMAAVAIAVMVWYEQSSLSPAAAFNKRDILWWVFPIWDPRGSDWGVTWWAPLWYLRGITWLFLASPLLLWLWRRSGPAMLLLPLAGMAYSEARLRADAPIPWQFEDAALYSFFWLLGFAYNDGRFAGLSRGSRGALCVLFAIASAAWAATQDVPGGVVNTSYPLHLFVGLAWLFGALTLEGEIGGIALRPRISGIVYWINERALTIYIWQSAGLFTMYQVLWAEQRPALQRDVFALPIVVCVTFLAVLIFGWIEDAAAGRSPRVWPERPGARPPRGPLVATGLGLAAGTVVASGIAALVVAGGSVVENPSGVVQAGSHTVPPSGIGLRIRTQRAQITAARPPRPVSGRSDPVTAEELQGELEGWLSQWGLSGATVTLRRRSGESWTGAVGMHEDDGPFVTNERYDIASVTKTFTAALIMRLVERGLVKLDDPVSAYVPDFPQADTFTVRQLLQHSSGLIETGEATPPFDALVEAAEAGLQFDPGTDFQYSSAGYFMLGLVIEDALGKPYTEALHEELLDPLGLTATVMDEEIDPLPYSTHPYRADKYGFPGIFGSSGGLRRKIESEFVYRGIHWSSGGLKSTTSDLARWGIALWGTNDVVLPASRDAMTTFLGKQFAYTGLGMYPFCPCWQEGNRLRAEQWGHLGVTGALEYDPEDGVAVAMSTSGTVVDENVLAALDDLSARLRRQVRGRPMSIAGEGVRLLTPASP